MNVAVAPLESPPREDAFRVLLRAARAAVDAGLASRLATRVDGARKLSPSVGAVAEAVADLALRGGKRLRAALVAAAFDAYGTGSWTVCEPAMVALELLQTYLLTHDDWMDDDDLRRGKPAVHVLLRARFGEGKAGDSAAILAGDLAAAYAQEVFLETSLDPARVILAARIFGRIHAEVVTGQLADMFPVEGGPGVETIHTLKTASYTATGPLLVGAALGGATEPQLAQLERFSRPLGVAFQLRDDVLDVFGDEATIGKPVGADLREGKTTSLVVEARRDPQGAALLARVLGNAGATRDDVASVARMMVETGARARVEARVRELCDEARRVLDAIGPTISERGKAELEGAVSALGERAS